MQPSNPPQKNQQNYDDVFRELISQTEVLDIAKNQFFQNFERNLNRMGIKCILERRGGYITIAKVYGNEDMFIEIMPVHENGNDRPIMSWYSYDGVMRKHAELEGRGIHGRYTYQAKFVLKSDDWDPQKAADLNLTEDHFNGECTIASVEIEGWDFQEFFQDALFIFSEQHNVRFYPQLSRKLTGF